MCSVLFTFDIFFSYIGKRTDIVIKNIVTKIEACLIIGLILGVHLLGILMVGCFKKHYESKMFFIFHTSCTLYIQQVINGKISSWRKAHINITSMELRLVFLVIFGLHHQFLLVLETSVGHFRLRVFL